ncbi:cathepsin S-like [Thrips palmi]|uniref:Cathepsin S-like n=1 Tax=Thrips palmi TaxID=161013 RepID=A0A6P8ZT66_THRPL|nr:cathepsin S-like [Thrips palmi]
MNLKKPAFYWKTPLTLKSIGNSFHEGSCRYKQEHSAGTLSRYVEVKQTEEALREAVSSVGPVATLFDATHWSIQHYQSGIYYEPACSSNVNHAVLIVGYGSDDDGQDYWIAKNSWGAAWGDQGYFKTARNRGNHCAVASWASYPVV